MIEPMIVTQEDDQVFCSQAPPQTAISPQLMGQADGRYLETTLRFTFADGEYTYKVTGWDELARALVLERVDG